MRIKIVLAIIILIYLFTRLFVIDIIPSSVYWDEASIGYNAYSISETGRDEWGEFLPLNFRAFGEFKLPVYIYSVAFLVKLFDLNATVVRIPSVLYFLLAIIFTYLISLKLFKKQRIALFSAFFMVITPWIFIFSRTGYEVSAGLAFYLAGIYFFTKFKENKYDILFSTAAFIISLYSYNSFRIISPLTFVILLYYQYLTDKKSILSNLRNTFASFALLAISFVPIIKLIFFDYGNLRYQAVSLQGNILEKIIAFTINYLSHFSINFLFLNGDSNLRSQFPGFGQLYFVSLVLIVAGLIKIVKSRKLPHILMLAILFIAPIPASLTKESPHALRSIVMIFPLSVISGIGYVYLNKLSKSYKKAVAALIPLVYFISFAMYFKAFILHYSRLSSEEWQYSYRMVHDDLQKRNLSNNTNIYISDKYGQPYIFYLFYNSVDPRYFWSNVSYNSPDRWGISTVEKIGNLTFIKNESHDFIVNSLIYLPSSVSDNNLELKDEYKFMNGTEAFYVYQK